MSIFVSLTNYAITGTVPAWETLGCITELSKQADAKECLDLQRKWLNDCIKNHDRCPRNPPAHLPKRLIDVGLNSTSIRLVEPHEITPYAALSHCWGGKQLLASTLSNLKLRKKSIDYENMPAVFQDAVTITRKLGLTYLWIDSLCIVQDSPLDWEIESSQMGRIYEGAQIVIAASVSPNSEASFLTRYETPVSHPLELKYKRRDGHCSTVKARPHIYHNLEPLETRAWAFQEQWLSTRLLRYTAHEVIWNCKTKIACECHCKDHANTSHYKSAYALMDHILPRPRLQGHASEWYGRWQIVLNRFTSLQITRPCDKLPALSGIAAMVSQATGSAYIGGLWKDHLLFDLQWTAADIAVPGDVVYSERFKSLIPNSSPTLTYRAPTFSWASVEAEILYQDNYHHKIFTPYDDHIVLDSHIIDAQCTLKGSNPFGEVTDGFIVIEGPLIQVYLSSEQGRKETNNQYRLLYEDEDECMYGDVLLTEGTGLDAWGRKTPTIRRASHVETSFLLHGDKSPLINGTVHCLCLYHCTTGKRLALVLGLSTHVPGAYERLGKVFWPEAYRAWDDEHAPMRNNWFKGAKPKVVKIV